MRRIIFVLAASSFAAVFEPNRGQSDPSVTFLATHENNTIFFTASETVLRTGEGALRWSYAGGRAVTPEPLSPRKETHSYRKGADPAKWLHNLPVYDRLIRRGVYPGIDVVYHDAEYDFVLKPGADPRQIRIRFTGETKATILPDGALELQSGQAKFIHKAPIAFTESNGVRTPVKARFTRISNREVAFELGRYDRRQTLTIDPEIAALSLHGGKGDDSFGATPAFSNGLHAGTTTSPEFPNAAPRARADRDIFLRNASGDVVIIGGSGDDIVHSFAPGFVVGETNSRDFPISWTAPFFDGLPAPAPQSTYGGGTSDGFLLLTDIVNSLNVRSTYWGGSGADRLKAVSQAIGSVYVAGESDSPDLANGAARGGLDILVFQCSYIPSSQNGFACTQPIVAGGSRDDFVHGLNFAGILPDISFHLLGETESPELITGGGASDALLLTFKAIDSPVLPTPEQRIYGGPGRDRLVHSFTAPNGAFIVAGDATADTKGRDLFALWLDPATLTPQKTWTFGGSGDETLHAAFLRDNTITLAGSTTSSDLPVKDAHQDKYGGGLTDGLLVQLTADAELTRASYLGGSGEDAITRLCTSCRLWSGATHFFQTLDWLTVSGSTTSNDWPLPTTANGGRDIFEATLVASRRPESQRIALAPGLSAILRLNTPILVPEGTPVLFAVEDPSLIRLSAETVPARAPGDRFGTTVPVTALDGAAGVTRVRMEVPGFETVWHEVTVGQMRVELRPQQAFGNDPECRRSCTLVLDFRIRFGDVDVPASLPPTNTTTDTILIRNLSPAVISFDNQLTFGAAALIRVFNSPIRLTTVGAGTAVLSVEFNTARIPPYIWRMEIPATPLGFEFSGLLPGLSLTNTRLLLSPVAQPRNVKLSSSDPALVTVAAGPDTPVASQSASTIPAGANAVLVRLQANKNAGDAVIRVEVEGEDPRELPLSIAPLSVRFVECGRKEIQEGSTIAIDEAMRFYAHPRTGAFVNSAPSGSSSAPSAFRLVSSDPSIVETSADPLSTVSSPRSALVVTAKALGRAALSLVPLNADQLVGASGCEVKVVPRKGQPAPIVVGELLSTTASITLPYHVTSPPQATIADPSRVQIGRPGSPTVQAAYSTVRIELTGVTRGETELRIEHPGQEPFIVPIIVQPTGALVRYDPVSIRVAEVATLRLEFVPVDPATRAPGPPQSPIFSFDPAGFRLIDDAGIVSSSYSSGRFTVQGRRTGSSTLRLALPDRMLLPALGTTLPVTVAKAKLRFPLHTIGERMQQPFAAPHCPTPCRIRSADPSRVVLSRLPTTLGGESIDVAPDATFHAQSLGGPGPARLFVTGEEIEDAEIVVEVVPVRWRWNVSSPVSALVGNRLQLSLSPTALDQRQLAFSFTPLSPPPELKLTIDPPDLATPSTSVLSLLSVTQSRAEFVLTAARAGTGKVRIEAPPLFQVDEPIDVSIVAPPPTLRPVTVRRDEVFATVLDPPPGVRYPEGQRITVTSLLPQFLLIANSPTDPGANQREFVVGPDGRIPDVYLIGLSGSARVDVVITMPNAGTTFSGISQVPLPITFSASAASISQGTTNQFITVSTGNVVLRQGASIPVSIVNLNPNTIALETTSVTLTADRPSVRIPIRVLGPGAATLRMELPTGYTGEAPSIVIAVTPATNRIESLTLEARALPQLGTAPMRLRLTGPVNTDTEYIIETSATTLIGFSLTERDRSTPQVRARIAAGSREAVVWIHSTAASTANSIGIPILVRPAIQEPGPPAFFTGYVDRAPGIIGFRESAIQTNLTAGSVNLTVIIGAIGPGNTMVTAPAIRLSPNAGDIPLQFTNSQPAVATVQGAPRLLAGQPSVTIAFTPRAFGETTITIQPIPGLSTIPGLQTAVLRVTGPAPAPVGLAGQPVRVGKLLTTTIALDFPDTIPASGVDVTFRSTNPALLKVHPRFETTTASNQITQRLGPGRQYVNVSALDSAGTVSVNVESPFFETIAIPVQLTPSAVRFRFGTDVPLSVGRGTFQVALETLRLDPGTLAAADPQAVAPGASLAFVMRSDNPQVVAPGFSSIPAFPGQMHFSYPFTITGTGSSTTIRLSSSPELTPFPFAQSQQVNVSR